jgi:signal peptidase I, archaeal type
LIAVVATYVFFTYGLQVVLGTSVPVAVVESNSMYPTLKVGDIIIVKGVEPSQIRVGDIIVFSSKEVYPGITVVHRVIGIYYENGEYMFRTKGDNNLLPDPCCVLGNEVKGIVIYDIPYLGYVTIFFQSYPSSFVFLLLILVIVLALIPTKRNKE